MQHIQVSTLRCVSIQNSGPLPKSRPKRQATSGDAGHLSVNISFTVRWDTPILSANSP